MEMQTRLEGNNIAVHSTKIIALKSSSLGLFMGKTNRKNSQGSVLSLSITIHYKFLRQGMLGNHLMVFYMIMAQHKNPFSIQAKYLFYKHHAGQNHFIKNSGHLWLAYTELQGGFNMLQLISVDSGHFTQPELWF